MVAELEARGFLVIDVDRLGHHALEDKRDALIGRFGNGIVGAGGKIDRKALGRIVFADTASRRELESIVHPAMREAAAGIIRENSARDVCINAALLFPMGLAEYCDLVFWVTAPFLKRLKWAMGRDRLSIFQTIRRFAAQRELRLQFSSRSVDIFSVRNSGSPGDLKKRSGKSLPVKESEYVGGTAESTLDNSFDRLHRRRASRRRDVVVLSRSG